MIDDLSYERTASNPPRDICFLNMRLQFADDRYLHVCTCSLIFKSIETYKACGGIATINDLW